MSTMLKTRLRVPILVGTACSFALGCERTTVESSSIESTTSMFLIESERPMAVADVISDRNVASLFLAGLLACSNHEPSHLAQTFDEMEELSQDPPACTGWRFVGAITDNVVEYERARARYSEHDGAAALGVDPVLLEKLGNTNPD